jgi:hypothetical protein
MIGPEERRAEAGLRRLIERIAASRPVTAAQVGVASLRASPRVRAGEVDMRAVVSWGLWSREGWGIYPLLLLSSGLQQEV